MPLSEVWVTSLQDPLLVCQNVRQFGHAAANRLLYCYGTRVLAWAGSIVAILHANQSQSQGTLSHGLRRTFTASSMAARQPGLPILSFGLVSIRNAKSRDSRNPNDSMKQLARTLNICWDKMHCPFWRGWNLDMHQFKINIRCWVNTLVKWQRIQNLPCLTLRAFPSSKSPKAMSRIFQDQGCHPHGKNSLNGPMRLTNVANKGAITVHPCDRKRAVKSRGWVKLRVGTDTTQHGFNFKHASEGVTKWWYSDADMYTWFPASENMREFL